MSHRSIESKKIEKLRRSLRQNRSTYIDLTEYLVDRRFASSRKKAEAMLVDGKVRVESHIVGRVEVPDPEKKDKTMFIPRPLLASHHRSNITVLT